MANTKGGERVQEARILGEEQKNETEFRGYQRCVSRRAKVPQQREEGGYSRSGISRRSKPEDLHLRGEIIAGKKS